MAGPFDMQLRAVRRDRAARGGAELFLFDRVFDDCLERLHLVPRRFEQALLIGSPSPDWRIKLRSVAAQVDVRDPGPLFAAAAGGEPIVEDSWTPAGAAYDLVLAVGTFDTVNDLPHALRLVAAAMRRDALFLGAMSGGDTLPRLRQAMRAADEASGSARAHVHPRIEAAAVAPLLATAGFVIPVVDVDRISVAYGSFDRLVCDLRAMGATNVLLDRPREPILRPGLAAARDAFAAAGVEGRITETFEVLHFAAWTPTGA